MPRDQIIEDQGSGSAPMKLPAPQPKQGRCPLLSSAGFTLVELLMVIAIIGALAMLVIPSFTELTRRAKNARAKQEVRLIETEINGYLFENGELPANLATIGRDTLTDPWGNGYVYDTTPARERFSNLLNDDFDLCSMGADGLTEAEVFGGAGTGKDDLVRGANGSFLGFGEDW